MFDLFGAGRCWRSLRDFLRSLLGLGRLGGGCFGILGGFFGILVGFIRIFFRILMGFLRISVEFLESFSSSFGIFKDSMEF